MESIWLNMTYFNQTVTLPEEMHEMKVTQSQCTCQPSVKLPKTFITNTKCISNVE